MTDTWRDWKSRNASSVIFVAEQGARAELPGGLPDALASAVADVGSALIDDGWVRLCGAGSPGIPGIAAISTALDDERLVVGFDVLGGVFALTRDSTAPPAELLVEYWAPDSLEWCNLRLDYAEFLHWLVSDDLHEFYAASRWSTWRDDIAGINVTQGFVIDPPLWTQDADDIDECAITAVPFDEVLTSAHAAVEQDGGDQHPVSPEQWRQALEG